MGWQGLASARSASMALPTVSEWLLRLRALHLVSQLVQGKGEPFLQEASGLPGPLTDRNGIRAFLMALGGDQRCSCVDLRSSWELVTEANSLTQKAWGWVASLLYQAPWVTWKQAALRAHPGPTRRAEGAGLLLPRPVRRDCDRGQ